jgi:hypothetical protein
MKARIALIIWWRRLVMDVAIDTIGGSHTRQHAVLIAARE